MILTEQKILHEVGLALSNIMIANRGLPKLVEYLRYQILVKDSTSVTIQVLYLDGDGNECMYNIAIC